jgi:hypothetical protein
MRRDTTLIVDEYGIEILVTYEWEQSAPQYEEGHGIHLVDDGLYVELEAVEIVIRGGDSIDILPQLNDKQQETIIGQLPIYE